MCFGLLTHDDFRYHSRSCSPGPRVNCRSLRHHHHHRATRYGRQELISESVNVMTVIEWVCTTVVVGNTITIIINLEITCYGGIAAEWQATIYEVYETNWRSHNFGSRAPKHLYLFTSTTYRIPMPRKRPSGITLG